MITKNTPMYKALYFDLDTKKLAKYCSEMSPTIGYYYIARFMMQHDFEHAQGSGYHSNFLTTDIVVLGLVDELISTYSWFDKCVNKFEVADLGENYNLMEYVDIRKPLEPEN